MTDRVNFWHHFLLCVIITLLLLHYPISISFTPWITFQVYVLKRFSQFKGILFHFLLGVFFSLIGSSLKLGGFSLILCLNYFTLIPLKRAFIDDRILASSLCSALFGLLFAISEFVLYQIFFSDIPFTFSQLIKEFLFKFLSDFSFSILIFSWLYFLNFSILKIKQIYLRIQEQKLDKVEDS